MTIRNLAIGLALAVASAAAQASTSLRWTFRDDADAAFPHVLQRINEKTGYGLTEGDFRLGEDRPLAFTHYRRYDQILKDAGVEGMAIRIWTEGKGRLLQVEARVEAPSRVAPALAELEATDAALTGDAAWADALARATALRSEDAQIRRLEARTVWEDGRLVRIVTLKARRGTHVVRVDLVGRTLARHDYEPYPNADLGTGPGTGELSVPARVYPVYEEYGGEILERRLARLKYIKKEVRAPTADPYAPLRDRRYLVSKIDPVRGNTPDGQAQGYWTTTWLRERAEALRSALPLAPNLPGAPGGALLQGRYATINIHPAAFDAFPGIRLEKRYGAQLSYYWKPVDGSEDDWEVVPTASFYGKPLAGRSDALERPATRHPQHDPATYVNEGYDEVQVYYAVNELFDSLRPLGFKDPDLGERPFNAFLFDPDIESQNNAYYTDDTINFTTYTPAAPNMARDNTTIWHELGHGVMDRLMGARLQLADTGGLSEGMADFVAELVLRASTGDAAFPGKDDQRIINATGFFLTNEVHDDGEAYGGVMKAILDAAARRFGERRGLAMVTDLVLEAMRFSRDHPALTAEDWFDRMLFADELGRPGVRRPGALRALVQEALAARNFAADGKRATFSLTYQGQEIVAGQRGSRGHDVRLELRPDERSAHELEVRIGDGESLKFKYPVTVKVVYDAGALQGAIDWEGEDQGPAVFTVGAPGETLRLPLAVRGTCDAINRTDGTCSDYAYVQVFNAGETRPVAKKRFYLRIKTL